MFVKDPKYACDVSCTYTPTAEPCTLSFFGRNIFSEKLTVNNQSILREVQGS